MPSFDAVFAYENCFVYKCAETIEQTCSQEK